MKHSVVQNYETVATSDPRRDALAFVEAGYAAINTSTALAREIRLEGETLFIGTVAHAIAGRRIFFVGIGKCAVRASEAIEKILGNRLTAGIALDVSMLTHHTLSKITAYIGTHPIPSEANERATKRIVEFLSDRDADDLVLMLISGGGSALLCMRSTLMTCADERTLFMALTAQGASIQDINTVRKHISVVRGGGLAKAAYPAEVIALIISDVPGDDIGSIASGPTVYDTSTMSDARAVLARYGISLGATTTLVETPKEQKYFEHVTNTLLLTNQTALLAMQSEAVARGYTVRIITDRIHGEAQTVGHDLVKTLHTVPARTVLLYAGETTVTLGRYSGSGGRNQELVLAGLHDIRPDELLISFASDGRDNTNHAGAIADAVTLAHARESHLSLGMYLAGHRSYDFFASTGDALITGYTGSNVSDLIIAMKN